MALDAYKMRIVAQGLKVLRQKVVALRLFNQDFSMEAALEERSDYHSRIERPDRAQRVSVGCASGTQTGKSRHARVAA